MTEVSPGYSNYTVINSSSGEILRSGYCMDMDIEAQAGEGEECIPGEAYSDEIWVYDLETETFSLKEMVI